MTVISNNFKLITAVLPLRVTYSQGT